MASYTNEFIINEDGSITRKKYTPIDSLRSKGDYRFRPTIMKFYCSSDHMKCGEQVKVYWAVQDADEVSITISQGGHSATELMPTEGEITLISNISAEDITITITAKNNSGAISSRKTISLSKRENGVLTNVGATVASVVIMILIIIKLISYFI